MLSVVHPQRVQWRDKEPVGHEWSNDGGGQPRSASADRGNDYHHQQVQREGARHRHVVSGGDEHNGQGEQRRRYPETRRPDGVLVEIAGLEPHLLAMR